MLFSYTNHTHKSFFTVHTYPMLTSLISFIIAIAVAGLVVYMLNWFVSVLSIPQPVKNAFLIVIGIVGLLWLLQFLNIYSLPR